MSHKKGRLLSVEDEFLRGINKSELTIDPESRGSVEMELCSRWLYRWNHECRWMDGTMDLNVWRKPWIQSDVWMKPWIQINEPYDNFRFSLMLMILFVLRIANATPGRFLALEEKAIEKILPLIRSKNPEIRLNAIKVLTALSEAPPGRRLLMEYFNQILVPLNDSIQEIRRAAKVLNAVVTFKP
ncbi:radial spoke head 14 [Caerostris extrusa]|uniref:Radial spoke head 14 n=1 Tax=Caerostris extrusa TaxID=172846 RepID=A0AAV4VR04_CAEEX|nr:radial spoke head 14 [Caerostris extrusa]